MPLDPYVKLSAVWQGRKESSDSMVSRMRTFLHYSRTPGRAWCGHTGSDTFVDLKSDPAQVPLFIEASLADSQQGEYALVPGVGCWTELFARERSDKASAHGPTMCVSWGFDRHNHVQIDSYGGKAPDPDFVSYDLVRVNLLAMAAAFEPEWCEAHPGELVNYTDYEVYNRPAIGLCWMVWLCPAYAELIEPPPDYTHIIKERYADGSGFMATGRDVFDCDNPFHLNQARIIHRQIDPLNYTVPFDGQSGRSNRVLSFPKV